MDKEPKFGWLYTNKDRPGLVRQIEETGIKVAVREADCGEGVIDPTLRIDGKENPYVGEKNICRYIATQQKPLKTTNQN